MAEQWYWCMKHERAEPDKACAATQRLGPYATREEAESYAERVKSRNQRWDADDKRWSG